MEGSAQFEADTRTTPGGWDVEIHSIELENAEEFSSHGLLVEFSEGVERMVDAYHSITGKLLPRVEKMVYAAWEEEMLSEVSLAHAEDDENYSFED